MENKAGDPVQILTAIIRKLRGDGGCPWDRKQTPRSMSVYLIEEVYELVNAIEKDDVKNVCEELGDVLFLIAFIAELYAENGQFEIREAADMAREKMIRRHPHVFASSRADTAEEVKAQWHQIKKTEKAIEAQSSILDSIPQNMPALMRAYRISERASRAGFDWSGIHGVMEKVAEELDELKTEIALAGLPSGEADQTSRKRKISGEFGDLLFTLVNVARFSGIHPETALTQSTQTFERRFRFMEDLARSQHVDFEKIPQPEKDALWDIAKKTVKESSQK